MENNDSGEMLLLEQIIHLQKKISEDIVQIKVIQAKHEENLKEHMARSEANEKNLELIRDQIKPIENHVAMFNGVSKAVGILGVIVAIVVGAIEVFNFFKN